MKKNSRLLTIVLSLMAFAAVEAATYSGSLPVLYINTTGSAEITSTETYVGATCYIDALSTSYTSLGTAAAPIALQIKGRGNNKWTNYDKKPYRIKFTAKQKPLGMSDSNKHFVLIPAADDDLAFLRFPVGMRLSMLMELDYTPEYRPIEVVLNGDYIGFYIFAEKVRVGKNRVNITEQEDNETDPTMVTGGWLVEIDDNEDDAQIVTTDGAGNELRITYDSPEVLSSVQSEYLSSQIAAINTAVYTSDKTSTEWQSAIDIDQLARYYVVQEVMDNIEAFHGGTYMNKDIGAATKWKFGPVWSFSDGLCRDGNNFIFAGETKIMHWIDEIYKFPAFVEKVKTLWASFYSSDYSTVGTFIDSFSNQISSAVAADYARWPQYGCADASTAIATFKARLKAKTDYLESVWGENGVDPVFVSMSQADDIVYDIMGRRVTTADRLSSSPLAAGIYILNHKKFIVK